MSSFEHPHYMYLFSAGAGVRKLSYGKDPEDAFEVLCLRLTAEEISRIAKDDYIRIRVPVGDYIDKAIVAIPKSPLDVTVTGTSGTSGTQAFRVRTAPDGTLEFVERTDIDNEHIDISTFLGDPPRNLARTKDADIGDANGDGYPDLIDNNSNGQLNGTHPVLRLNNAGAGFSSIDMEPLNVDDE